MKWYLSHRADPRALPLADRHYNRQKPGTPQFVPPGRCLVLLTRDADAVWVTSYPFPQYVKHEWAGAWVNSLFRKEVESALASDLIREAVAATCWLAPRLGWGKPPDLGLVTFVDPRHVKRTRKPGYTYVRAGFRYVGRTKKDDLLAFRMPLENMPPAAPPWNWGTSKVKLAA